MGLAKKVISFEIPNTNDDFDGIVEPILVDHSDYARDTLNERRQYNFKLIGLNETSINGQPATRAQYHTSGELSLRGGTMTLSYFITTDDYTGYRLLYSVDGDQFSRYLPLIERMVSTFRITK